MIVAAAQEEEEEILFKDEVLQTLVFNRKSDFCSWLDEFSFTLVNWPQGLTGS